MKTALVLGAGGFIGSHMVSRLKKEGYWVRGVDLKHNEFSPSEADEFLLFDLTESMNVAAVMGLYYNIDNFPFKSVLPFSFHKPAYGVYERFDECYQFAADMGGAGYIFTGDHDADIVTNSALINLHVAKWASYYKIQLVFYSSSACIYPKEIQMATTNQGLKESDAWPANPDSDYGVEKIFSERLYLAYARNYGLNVRVARFHNIYGPLSPFDGQRSKAPAAMCKKVADATSFITIWGDGKQTRSFLYIDDCIDAVRSLMKTDHQDPINIGSEEMITIEDLALMVMEIAGKPLNINFDTSKPQGVRGRNSNNDIAREVLGTCTSNWEPKFTLRQGMEKTFNWINQQVNGL